MPAVEPAMQEAVLSWYAAEGRPLAFRRTADPWAILLSEVLAQQTQAARAAEAWERLLALWPTPAAMAVATPADVLRAWRGLGYNRRALNLRRAAIAIVDDHGGRLPADLGALQRLPGVGPYTARAVAALAFGMPVGAVDTNVRRVLGRAVAGSLDAISGRELQAIADASVPAAQPGTWTHALMDVGSRFCRPRNPRCADCPAAPWCRALAGGVVVGPTPRPRTASRREPAFPTTTRWLRGRILDRLRDADDGAWHEIPGSVGRHDHAAVDAALAALAGEGLLQRHPSEPRLARLPTA